MKRILSCIVLLCSCLCISAQKQITRSIFDLNGDNRIDIADVTRLINRVCGKKEGDSIVITIAKVDTIHYVVTDTIYEHIKVYVKDTIYVADTYTLDGVEYVMPEAVDLGLPSGNLWASLDLGTNSIEEYNLLDLTEDMVTRNEYYMITSAIDRVSSSIGKGWTEPEYSDWIELLEHCQLSYIDDNCELVKVTGQNGNHIIIKSSYSSSTIIDNRVLSVTIEKEEFYEDNKIIYNPLFLKLPPFIISSNSIRPMKSTAH